MTGRRLPDGEHGPGNFLPGDYWQSSIGWICITPNGHMGNLSKHRVTEHQDSTITVAPSILVSNSKGELWHGFLERGIWRSC